MSDRTPCNFCSLKKIQAQYGDFNVILADDLEHGGKEVRHKETGRLIAWFMELSDECAC
jgi:hypothetical protein